VAEGWIAAYRLQIQDERPVISEVRVIPAEAEEPPGQWSRSPSSIPPGGLPGTVLRRLRIGDALALFRDIESRWESEFGEAMTERIFHRHGARSVGKAARRPGRGGRSDAFYARWAEAYVELLARGSRSPIKDLAADPPIAIDGFDPSESTKARNTVRGLIREARRRGLLSEGTRGKAGGKLRGRAVELAPLRGRKGSA